MPEPKASSQHFEMTLFVCSKCEACDRAVTYLNGWINGRRDASLRLVSIAHDPEEVVLYGVNQTPALLIDDDLLGQDLTPDDIARLLNLYQH